MITLTVNDQLIKVEENCTVASAIYAAGIAVFRRSVNGEPRAPLCGMGVCFECRVTIDGVPHSRSCNIAVREGMEIMTDE